MRMVEVAMDGSDDRDRKEGDNRLVLLHAKRRDEVPCRPNIELFLNQFFRTLSKGTQRVSAEIRARFLYWGTDGCKRSERIPNCITVDKALHAPLLASTKSAPTASKIGNRNSERKDLSSSAASSSSAVLLRKLSDMVEVGRWRF